MITSNKIFNTLKNTALVFLFGILSLVGVNAHAQVATTSETFNAPGLGVFVVPQGVSTIFVDVTGAGGGGAGGAFTYGGGGGGAGASVTGFMLSVTPGQVIPFTVGTGGVGGTGGSYSTPSGNGGDGVASTFGDITSGFVSVPGGKGGQGVFADGNTNQGYGGLGGIVPIGFEGQNGENGGNGDVFVGERNHGGNGGNSSLAFGGTGGFGNSTTYILPIAGNDGSGGGAGSGWAAYSANDNGARGGNGVITVSYIQDLVAPVITILGNNPETVEAGSIYVDAFATAWDDFDNAFLTVSASGTVNTNATGTYYIEYSATDAGGNTATATRTVYVVDSTAPAITAPAIQVFEATGATTTPVLIPATAIDSFDPFVIISYEPHDFALGTTTVLWTATDSSGNSATTTSLVVIRDTTAPVVSLNGLAVMSLTVGMSFIDPGATAFDLVDGTTTVNVFGSVNTNATGTYYLTYSSTDNSENTGFAMRTVNVLEASTTPDITAPTTPVISTTSATGTIITETDISWLDSTDAESGIAGYIFIFDNINGTIISSTTVGTSFTSATSASSTSFGTVWFHVVAIDNAGNISGTATVGPFVISDSAVLITNSTLGSTFYSLYSPSLVDSIIASTTGVTTIRNSTLSTFWNVDDSNISTTVLDNSTLNISTSTNSTILNSILTRCIVTNSSIDGYVATNCSITNSNLDPGEIIDSVLINVDGTDLYIYFSTSTDSQFNNAHIYYSVITNSTVSTSTVLDSTIVDSTITDSSVSTSTIDGNSNINNSTVTFSDITNSDITDSVISSSTLTNVVSASSSITNTVLSDATTTNAVIDSGIIYSGTIEIGGVVYVITTPTLISSLGGGTPDTTAPVITILGSNPANVLLGDTYTDAGATATDDVDGDITANISTSSDVDTNATGTYSVVYTISDAAGNEASSTRTVIVSETIVDTTAPVITILGANPTDINIGDPYIDAGATATDDIDGDVTANISSTTDIDLGSTGTYSVVYTVSDAAGNEASSTRIVNIIGTSTPDITAPNITILGSNPVSITVGSTYVDAGATAMDNRDGDITARIASTSDVDTNNIGTYSVVYSVSDDAGNEASSTRTVIVTSGGGPSDTVPPVITILGLNPATVTLGSTYIDAGAMATDDVDGDITDRIASTSNVNTSAEGTYSVTYSVSDNAGNSTSTSRTVIVVAIPDLIPPVITILGNNPETVVVGTDYTDAGATALDNIDGDLTSSIVTDNPITASSTAGTYYVIYTVSDTAGNEASSTRTVHVVSTPDTTAPIITILGLNPYTTTVGSTYVDAGATANDDVDGDITSSIFVSSDVNTNATGTYSVAYSATDASGNTGFATRTVEVIPGLVDVVAPVITVVGGTPTTVFVGDTYADQGATATDNIDGDITSRIVTTGLPIDTSATGTFEVIYSVSDNAGNEASTTRTVNVIITPIDNIPPVITITGGTPITVILGDTYTDQGATATDDVDGDIPAVEISNDVDTNATGTYSVVYSATDSSSNTSTATRDVNVIEASSTADVIPPVITIIGGTPVTITVGETYTDQGATATDDVDGDITASIIPTNNVNNTVVGTYTVVYTVSDAAGNTSTATRDVNVVNPVVDTIAPVITIIGGTPTTATLNSTYTDAGATALDNVDGDITTNIITTNNVNTSATGTYTVVYSITDAAGNTSEATRIVNVIETDTIAPIITINGANPMDIIRTTPYVEAGATAMDNVDGDISSSIITSGSVNTSIVATYIITYSATDSSGNTAEATRVVNVIEDNVAPVITILGSNPVNITVGNDYVDAGATAMDNIDGNLTSSIITTNPVSTSTPIGTYFVTYQVTDSSGNMAYEIRTVNVNAPDTTAPIITILGSNPITLVSGTPYIDAGATAFDNIDGDITSNISVQNFVNNMSVGAYSVIYTVSDAAGNTASSTRTVNVVAVPDTTAPVITILGNNPESITVGSTYTDAGATATDDIDGDITSHITVSSNVNTSVVGSYAVTYNVADGAGNTASSTRAVEVVSGGSTVVNTGGSVGSGYTIPYNPPAPETPTQTEIPAETTQPEITPEETPTNVENTIPENTTTEIIVPETNTSGGTTEEGITVPSGIGTVATSTEIGEENASTSSEETAQENANTGFVATVIEGITNMPRSLAAILTIAILAVAGWFIYKKTKKQDEVIDF